MKFTSKNIPLVLGFLGLFLLSSGISWAAFTYLGKTDTGSFDQGGKKSKINLDLPKTEECPINGEKFTKAEREIWEKRRPLLAIIENHQDSRPQSGLSRADVVYEFVAEGGITRFVNVFYCGVAADDFILGPIRSARIYFMNIASEYAQFPIFMHVGGANNICNNCPRGIKPVGDVHKKVDVFSEMIKLGWRGPKGNALDLGTNVGYPATYRDYERIPGAAAEHTVMAKSDLIFAEAEKRGFGAKDDDGVVWNKTFKLWKFTDGQTSSLANAKNVKYGFWNNKDDYDIEWKYDSASNSYLRFNGGKAHTDYENKQQLSVKNVIVQFVEEEGPVDKEHHMYYEVIGTGKALFFQNGTVIEVTWKKATRSDRTIFTDDNGSEIKFVRGKIWISAIPEGNDVDYTP